MSQRELPRFPYGAVYFRYSNPPREDWERDYRTAAEDGMTAFRHWFLWTAVEVAPGRFVWDDYDRQMDLAADNGLKTVIAEMITAAPEWAWRQYAHARYEDRGGGHPSSGLSGSCVTGGFPGLCLDHDDVKEAAGRFLTELVNRYKDRPGMGWYDIWNECNYGADICFCPATQARFREWLKAKYVDLKTLGEAWFRPSYAEWEDVQAPRHGGPYPEVLDWLEFRQENFYAQMQWRYDLIRALDPVNPITAHGVVGSLTHAAQSGADDWRAASIADSFGYTWGAARHGNEPWKQWHAVDLVRAACRGKQFWHAEAYAGPLWMQGNVLGRDRSDGRICDPEHIRLWELTSFAAGARGRFGLRWRPLLDGPLFGAFGGYGMAGSRTPRSERCALIAKWAAAPEQQDLWQAQPVQGEIGILYVPETQLFCYAQQGNTDFYAKSMQGAYRGFFDNHVQADWVALDDLGKRDLLYLPLPYMLSAETATRVARWVEAGGTLISEGCPGYFGDRGHVGTTQPNLGLDAVFGARESHVEFTPDLVEGFSFLWQSLTVPGSLFLQAYEPTGGTTRGEFAGEHVRGKPAVIENRFGKGRTLLVGTFPSYAYFRHPTDEGKQFFARLLDWAGKQPHLRVNDDAVVARLATGPSGNFLWIVNHAHEGTRDVEVELGKAGGAFQRASVLWGGCAPTVSGRLIRVAVDGRDAAVLRLE
ncbi:MAG: beta-galactosidase [Armatimonadetes bacterium CG_4_8_14_3_um_filter_66_20]|nr:MAG: beta-galactosidase [Armatimonadetes bacterium CG_4_8_14_3_um_filter_66_20]